MAKANLVLPDGTTVSIDGAAEEVATLLERFATLGGGGKPSSPRKKSAKATGTAKANKRKGPQELIEELAEQNYFKSKRSLSEVQKKLEEGGHIYAMSSLST